MNKNNIKYRFIAVLLFSITLNAQSIRSVVNDGVDSYENNNFPEAESSFKKGIENDVENFEARFNLGDAIYKQGRYEEALEEFKNSMALARTDNAKASIFHNLGNTLLKSEKLKESIGAYREALKLNPNDLETKYNLSYAIKQMQNQNQNQDQQNKQDQDNQDKNNEEQNQDQQDQENKDDKKENEKEQNQDQQKNQDKQDQEQQNQQPSEPKDEISKDEAQRILEALKNNEAELQKKMRQQKTKKTNVEKDW